MDFIERMFVGSEFRSCVNREVGLGGPGWASVDLGSHSLYLSSLVHIKTRLASWAPVPNCRSLRTYNSIKDVRLIYRHFFNMSTMESIFV